MDNDVELLKLVKYKRQLYDADVNFEHKNNIFIKNFPMSSKRILDDSKIQLKRGVLSVFFLLIFLSVLFFVILKILHLDGLFYLLLTSSLLFVSQIFSTLKESFELYIASIAQKQFEQFEVFYREEEQLQKKSVENLGDYI